MSSPARPDPPQQPVPPRENVAAVTRALRILDAFHAHEQGVSLAELSRRVGMEKTTVLRTARTLARSGYLTQIDDGRWRLGPAAGWLGVRYQTAFDVSDVIDSVLRRLTAATGETTALFVREGSSRTCIARVERPSLKRAYIRVGEKLPLDRGASGRVLTAFESPGNAAFAGPAAPPAGVPCDDARGSARAAQGDPSDAAIRRRGYCVSVGERDARVCSISVPVFAAPRKLFGALCVSGETARVGRVDLLGWLDPLIASAAELGRALRPRA
jgi:DNA-binding IclR family transcriptional regulator